MWLTVAAAAEGSTFMPQTGSFSRRRVAPTCTGDSADLHHARHADRLVRCARDNERGLCGTSRRNCASRSGRACRRIQRWTWLSPDRHSCRRPGSLASFFAPRVGAGAEDAVASEFSADASVMYFAGDAVNLCMQPGEQKKYVSPRYCALPRACRGSRVMPQTGSFDGKIQRHVLQGYFGFAHLLALSASSRRAVHKSGDAL